MNASVAHEPRVRLAVVKPLVKLQTLAPRAQTLLAAVPFHTWDLPDGEEWAAFFRNGAGILIRFPNLADFVLSADATQVTCTPTPGVSDVTIEHLYLNQVLPLALGQLGKLVFHASAVEIAGGAAAFSATSGRGKSSIAAAFAADGSAFLTDDALVLEQVDASYEVQPSPPSLRLWVDSKERLVSEEVKLAPAVSYTPKARLLAGEGFPHCDVPRRLLAAYFLGDGATSEATFRRLSPAEGLIGWASHSFLLDIEDRSLIVGHFDRVAALANSVPCFALDYPRRYDALPEVLAAVRAHVRSLSPPV